MIKKFKLKVIMEERWIPYFMSMLYCMERYGNLNCSGEVGLYSDGKGDFRPKFKTNINWDTKDPVQNECGNRLYRPKLLK